MIGRTLGHYQILEPLDGGEVHSMKLHQGVGLAVVFLLSFATAASGQWPPSTAPEDVGLSSERLSRIDSLMQDYIDDGKLAGVVTVVARRGKVAHIRTQGLMDVERGRPMATDAIFRIASMTKPITSVAVMMLYEEGRFQLEDPVSDFIPAFGDMKVVENPGLPEAEWRFRTVDREMTIRDLLTHTAGLPGCGGNTPLDSKCRSMMRQSPQDTLREKVERRASGLPVGVPCSDSGTGTTIPEPSAP